jgi:cell division protein FtsL
MAKRRVGARGRAVVAVVLAAFLVVTTAVVWRRSLGSKHAHELQQMGEKHVALEAERTRLEGEIRVATSRAKLTAAAERLGLKTPNDSQVINLPRPRASGR